MSTPTYNARKFTDAVYRRLVVLRTVEQLGRGVLVGSVVATLLMLIAIWQSLPTGMILFFSSAIGLLVGIGLAVVRRPTRWQSIVETDRQLRFDDLLATALSTGAKHGDFISIVTATADARCAHHSPSEVLIRQLGLRSWSAIGLAMCVAATLAIIPLGPSRSQASDAGPSILAATPSAPTPLSPASASSPIAITNDPLSDNASSSATPATSPPEESKTGTDVGGSKATNPQQAGASAGRARTQEKSSAPLGNGNSATSKQNPNATIAGGGGPAQTMAAHGISNGATVSPGHDNVNIAPPRSGVRGDRPGTGVPSMDNQIPAEDREMVREFFSEVITRVKPAMASPVAATP